MGPHLSELQARRVKAPDGEMGSTGSGKRSSAAGGSPAQKRNPPRAAIREGFQNQTGYAGRGGDING